VKWGEWRDTVAKHGVAAISSFCLSSGGRSDSMRPPYLSPIAGAGEDRKNRSGCCTVDEEGFVADLENTYSSWFYCTLQACEKYGTPSTPILLGTSEVFAGSYIAFEVWPTMDRRHDWVAGARLMLAKMNQSCSASSKRNTLRPAQTTINPAERAAAAAALIAQVASVV